MASLINPMTKTTTKGTTAETGETGDMMVIQERIAVQRKNMLNPLLN